VPRHATSLSLVPARVRVIVICRLCGVDQDFERHQEASRVALGGVECISKPLSVPRTEAGTRAAPAQGPVSPGVRGQSHLTLEVTAPSFSRDCSQRHSPGCENAGFPSRSTGLLGIEGGRVSGKTNPAERGMQGASPGWHSSLLHTHTYTHTHTRTHKHTQ